MHHRLWGRHLWAGMGLCAGLCALTALAPAAAPIAVHAQTPARMMDEGHAPACTAPVAPGGILAPWATPITAPAGADIAHAATLPLAQAVALTLRPTPAVRYALRPEKPGGSVSFGGMAAFDVTTAGIYRIALSAGAWLDVLAGAQPQVSTAHGHGPDCTGIRKMVDFALTPGHYTVQISANGAPQITVMAVAVP